MSSSYLQLGRVSPSLPLARLGSLALVSGVGNTRRDIHLTAHTSMAIPVKVCIGSHPFHALSLTLPAYFSVDASRVCRVINCFCSTSGSITLIYSFAVTHDPFPPYTSLPCWPLLRPSRPAVLLVSQNRAGLSKTRR